MRHFSFFFLLMMFATLAVALEQAAPAQKNKAGEIPTEQKIEGEPENSYRVSGIMVVSGSRNLALIELPDGDQLLLRKGSMLGRGEVVEITRSRVRIRFPDGEKLLYLKGFNRPADTDVDDSSATVSRVRHSSTLSPALRPIPSSEGIVTHKTDVIGGMNRKVSPPQLREALNDSSPEKGESAENDLTRYLAPLLDIPLDARIVRVNHGPIVSAQDAVNDVYDALAQGNVVSLTVKRATGEEQVYLMPENQP